MYAVLPVARVAVRSAAPVWRLRQFGGCGRGVAAWVGLLLGLGCGAAARLGLLRWYRGCVAARRRGFSVVAAARVGRLRGCGCCAAAQWCPLRGWGGYAG